MHEFEISSMSGELGQNEKTCDMGPCLTKKFDKIVDSIDAIVLPLCW